MRCRRPGQGVAFKTNCLIERMTEELDRAVDERTIDLGGYEEVVTESGELGREMEGREVEGREE